MNLRQQLFLSSSALMVVALVGLLLGTFSVLQLTKGQSREMSRNMEIIDASLAMHQELSKQITLMISENLDRPALQQSRQRFLQRLQEAKDSAIDNDDLLALNKIEHAHVGFEYLLSKPVTVRRELLTNDEFGRVAEFINQHITNVQMRYMDAVQRADHTARERAWLITALLGLVGLGLVVVGLVSAHNSARYFSHPIQALAQAADQIGKGDFNITLPITPIAEMSTLTRRFGLMAEALREFKNTDIEALHAEQRRLQAVLDSIDDGLLIFDCEGLLEHYNPVAERQLGWQQHHIGQRPGDVLQRPELDEQLQQVLAGESLSHAVDDLHVEVDGETRVLTYSLTAVNHADGDIFCAVMVLHDVTEQRAFERMRSEFVLRASHELRTPITSISMAFNLLQERLDFAAVSSEADLLRTVDDEMKRLLRLIDDLLNFSRYQSGLQQLNLVPCDPETLLRQARERFAVRAREQGVNIQIDAQGPLPPVPLDGLLIERLFDNLLVNALRHCNVDGEINLRAWREGERIFFSVEDNGEGILYRQQARIFQPFVQVGKNKGSAGLGLALCKEIIELHGGHIGVLSQPGKGARFYLWVPL
ncbi:MAG: histidine kinase [Gammaproteobacteria bacterium BRH_c0]|nr:MAG: histidine kinase [Gammaproteobacteria bacterium BRH_c0]